MSSKNTGFLTASPSPFVDPVAENQTVSGSVAPLCLATADDMVGH